MSVRARRVLAVTGGLMLTGAIVGALCAMMVVVLIWSFDEIFGLEALRLAALLGAIIGAPAAPLLAWALLRHVPLGRAVLWCAIGTTLGTAFIVATPNPILMAIPYRLGILAGPIGGFLIAAVLLRLTHRRAPVRAPTSG